MKFKIRDLSAITDKEMLDWLSFGNRHYFQFSPVMAGNGAVDVTSFHLFPGQRDSSGRINTLRAAIKTQMRLEALCPIQGKCYVVGRKNVDRPYRDNPRRGERAVRIKAVRPQKNRGHLQSPGQATEHP